MTSFDERKKAQEDKYAHEEELMFKVRVRGAKQFGEWTAEQIGLPPAPYAEELVNLVTVGKGDAELVAKARADAQNKGKGLSADLLVEKLNRCLAEAKEQFLKG